MITEFVVHVADKVFVLILVIYGTLMNQSAQQPGFAARFAVLHDVPLRWEREIQIRPNGANG